MNNMLPIVILAGGLATRLRPLTANTPKSLIEINGEPFINHQLRMLMKHGVRDIILCVGYRSDMIEKHLGDGRHFGMRIQYSYDGPILLGTGGAIKKALPLLSDAFFVIYGDSYLDCDYAAAQESFTQQNKKGLMTVFHNQGQWDTSNIEFADGNILNYDKENRNDRMHYIDYGLGILTKEAFKHIGDNKRFDLAMLYQQLLRNKQLAAHEVEQRFYEVGSFAGIKELEYYLTHNKPEPAMTE